MRIELQDMMTNKVYNAYVGCIDEAVNLVTEICESMPRYFILSTSYVDIPPANRDSKEIYEASLILNEAYARLHNKWDYT
jgi:hypothetical protein